MESVSRIFGKTPQSDRASLRMVRKYDWIYNSTKIQQNLGFKPQIRFEDGIRRIVAEYQRMGII